MKAWTDYPLWCMGDIPNEKAPVRQVEVLSYDGDKYCDICIGNHIEAVKAGYLYQSKGRYGQVSSLSREQLSSLEHI